MSVLLSPLTVLAVSMDVTVCGSLGLGWMSGPFCWSYIGGDGTQSPCHPQGLSVLHVHPKEDCNSKPLAMDMVLCMADLALGKEYACVDVQTNNSWQ